MPKIVRALKRAWTIIVEPCLEEDESYAIRSQKLAVIAFAIIASNALFTGVPVAIIAGLFDSSLGTILITAGMVHLLITSSIIPYFYLRFTSKLPQWVPDLQVWSTLPSSLFFSLFVHQGGVLIVCSICVLVGILMRVRGWQLFLLYGLCINVFHALINYFAEELPEVHDAFYSTQYLSIRIMYMIGSNICPLLLFGLGLHLIMKEFVERSDQADAAIAMNLAVADKLRRYDTDGVAVILAANKGKVDEKLLEAFAAIQQNLEEYRPHIPDYVIAATMGTEDSADGGDAHEGDGEIDEGTLKTSDSQVSHLILDNSSNSSKQKSFEKAESSNGSFSSSSRLSTSQNVRKSQREAGIRRRETSRSGDFSANRSGNRGGLLLSEASKSGGGLLLASSHLSSEKSEVKLQRQQQQAATRQFFIGRATTVFIRFVSAECGSCGSSHVMGGTVSKANAPSAMNILSNCIDAASRHAKAHKGALQYMQGCGLMVSFNAASRVATHEANACAFALALKTSVEELLSADLVMHATIVTTNVLSFFAGNSGQLMLTVLGGFMPVHTAMHHYLSQTVDKAASCVLLSDGAVPAITMMYDHRLLGAFSFVLPTSSSVSGNNNQAGSTDLIPPIIPANIGEENVHISQLIRMSLHDDEDEWLYHAAERDQNDPISRSNKAVRAALDGDAVPVEFSIQCDTSDVVLMKCVKERLEVCGKDETPFGVRTIPTVMW